MKPFRRIGTRVYWVKVQPSHGSWRNQSTATADHDTAKKMARMLEALGKRGKQAWYFLDAIAARKLTVSQLYAAYSADDLDGLRSKMEDVDLSPLVEEWLDSRRGNISDDTIAHYRKHVRSLIPERSRFGRTRVTYETLARWLSEVEGEPATRRKYHAAMSGFCQYLRRAGVLRDNPMRDVKAPRAAAPRQRFIEADERNRLLAALPEPFRAFEALIHATGMEVSVACRLRRRDIDLADWTVHAKGTKNRARNRHVPIDPWARQLIETHVRSLLPNAPLFPGVSRWTASDKHREACVSTEIEDYQLRDARHTFAVRAIRAGASFEVVARLLGHVNTTMVAQVYGRFVPSDREMREWQGRAAERDARRAAR